MNDMKELPLLNPIPVAMTEEDVQKLIAQMFGVSMTPTPQGMIIQVGGGPYRMETIVIPPDVMTQAAKAWALFLKAQEDQARVVNRVLVEKRKA